MSEEKKDKAANINDKEVFYTRLSDELDKNNQWPTKYMYKFIVPNDEKIVEEVISFFPENIKINKNYSRSGKYVSISIITNENTSAGIIDRYKSMENIEGLISL